MNPLVSIIIPTYNRAHIIGETLDSIIAQSYTNWECIIVDDGSTDNTDYVIQEYLDKDSRFQYHIRPLDRLKGPNSCRNYGFEMSKGDYINWLDSDDLYFENSLSTWLDSLQHNMNVVVAKVVRFNSSTRAIISENNTLSNSIIEDYFTGKITYYVSGPFWERSFLEKQEDLFDEKIRYLDDWDFNLRMLLSQPEICYLDIPLIQYRIHENTLSQEVDKLNFEELQSEFYAREKMFNILKRKGVKNINFQVLNTFIKFRYRYVLRSSLFMGHYRRFYFFKKLIISQLYSLDFKGIIKSFTGFILYLFFKRGYNILR